MKDHLSFSGSERNGIIILSVIIILLLGIRYILPSWLSSGIYDVSEFEQEIEALNTSLSKDTTRKKIRNIKKIEETGFIKAFDPNTASEKTWGKAGLNNGQIATIKKFINKGGRFYKKEDLKEIYVINEADYNRIAPFLIFPADNRENPDQEPACEKKQFIDINTADERELMKLKGIGPVFSSRIVKYRKLLGGFVNKKQLLDVYGIDQALFDKITPKIIIDTGAVTKININTCSFNQLCKHPYVNQYHAKVLISFRDNSGSIKRIEQLRENNIFDQDTFNKIKMYLTL